MSPSPSPDPSTPSLPRGRWRLPVAIASAAALFIAGAVVATNQASAATIVQGTWYQVISRFSGKALAVSGGSTVDGAGIVQVTPNSSSTSQQFRFESSATGWWRLIARHSGKAIAVSGGSTADGANVIQQSVTSSFHMQFAVVNTDSTFFRLRNRTSNKVLDVWEWSTAENARISQFGDLNGTNQQWQVVPVGSTPTTPPSNPAPQTGLVGWATTNGGTTGGGNASVTTVSSASALTNALGATGAAVIRVTANISCSGMLRVRSNKTILGNGSATISGCGLNINGDRNIIIRNLRFNGWDDDAINVQESATNIWIDHNTFGSGADGAVDIKRGSDFITVSWNRVQGHDKSMLLGHSDDNGAQDTGHLRVTYHHNWFDGSNQRHPRVRFGNPVHVYNNFYSNIGSYGVASTENAGVLVEGNYFENTADPFHRGEGDSGPGSLVARNNHFVNSGSGQAGGSVASIPYSYRLDTASSVKSIVTGTGGAGAGRISV